MGDAAATRQSSIGWLTMELLNFLKDSLGQFPHNPLQMAGGRENHNNPALVPSVLVTRWLAVLFWWL